MPRVLLAVLTACAVLQPAAFAQERPGTAQRPAPRTTYLRVGGRGSASDAVLFEPPAGVTPSRIALMFAHPGEVTFNHASGREMARRGYRILMVTNEGDEPADTYGPSLSAALKYLRGLAGVEKVAIITHSGGGHHMTFYQNVAENGPKACSGPEKVSPCRTDRVTGLEKADALILLDPTLGAFHQMSSLDPAVDSASPRRRRADLDMFAAVNGYDDTNARASYSAEFAAAFYAAQAARSAAVIEQAKARLALIEQGRGDFKDDEPFVVPGMGPNAIGARLYQPDVRIASKTRGAHPLLKADGSVTTTIAKSVRPPSGARPIDALGTLGLMSQYTTVRGFLAQSGIRIQRDFAFTEDNIVGVDWSSAMNSTPGNAEGVTVPTLVMAMTCHYLMVPDEIIYDHLAATDKELVMVEGATHGFAPCRPEYGDTARRTFDYVATWLKKPGRFASTASK